jgi:hypothetical protein
MSPCEACKDQMKKGKDDEPHNKLFRVWSNSFRAAVMRSTSTDV